MGYYVKFGGFRVDNATHYIIFETELTTYFLLLARPIKFCQIGKLDQISITSLQVADGLHGAHVAVAVLVDVDGLHLGRRTL